jgi:hypothetical protein
MFIFGLLLGFMIGYIVKSIRTWKEKVKEVLEGNEENVNK